MNERAYHAVRSDPNGAGVFPLERAWIRLTGTDRATFLDGQVSNDIAHLQEGQGIHACLLNNTGHLLANLYVNAFPDSLLIETTPTRGETVVKSLNRYLIRERVEIEDISQQIGGVTVQGAAARNMVAAVLGDLGDTAIMPLSNARLVALEGPEVTLIHHHRTPSVSGYDLLMQRVDRDKMLHHLLANPGAELLDEDTVNVVRVEAGLPKWGAELDESIIPLEAKLYSAIHQNKGCYMGQEVIARILSRGHTNRSLVGLRLSEMVNTASHIFTEPGEPRGKDVGRITSVVTSPTAGVIALGYVRNEQANIGQTLFVGDTPATVTALPFVA